MAEGEIAGGEPNEAPAAIPEGVFAETVVAVEHFTDRLFSFRITRPASFRFRSGEFVMIGLPPEAQGGKTIWRAYSIASPAWDEELEFFSIKVKGGPLTEKLKDIRPGDTIWMRSKPTGTLVLDALLPGKRLFLLATGTGIAPFASIVRDPECYEKFDRVILAHTCRLGAELTYGRKLVAATLDDPLVGEFARQKLVHFASTTREPSAQTGRVTDLIENGAFFTALDMAPFVPADDRVMLCGSMAMIKDMRAILEKAGFSEGSNANPGQYVVERAFVD